MLGTGTGMWQALSGAGWPLGVIFQVPSCVLGSVLHKKPEFSPVTHAAVFRSHIFLSQLHLVTRSPALPST